MPYDVISQSRESVIVVNVFMIVSNPSRGVRMIGVMQRWQSQGPNDGGVS